MDSAASPSSSPLLRRDHEPQGNGPRVPTLQPLTSTPDGFGIGDDVGFSALLAQGSTVCVLTMARIYDMSYDIHPIEVALDAITRRMTRNVIVLAKPSSVPGKGNGPWETREALRRLTAANVTVHEPSDELIAFLGIADGRGGLRNAMHRFDAGRLTRNWTAATANPTEDHYAGRDIFAKSR